jgi:chloramphenicol 3-O phosphotransferase
MVAKIVYINGASSSGKSSIAKILQEMLDEAYLCLGIDTFIDSLPFSYRSGSKSAEGFKLVMVYENNELRPRWHDGPVARCMFNGMYAALGALANENNNMIVDDVCVDLSSPLYYFSKHEVVFVGLFCPLVVLEARERGRPDRTQGAAKADFDLVHKNKVYDIEIDTSLLTSEQSASVIFQYIKSGNEPQAFNYLRQGITDVVMS